MSNAKFHSIRWRRINHRLRRIETRLIFHEKKINHLNGVINNLVEAQKFNFESDESIYNALNVLKDYTIMELKKLEKKNKNLHEILGLQSYEH